MHLLYFDNTFMEEKKAEISNYLRSTVSPFVTPLMEELVKKRPADLLLFAKKYVEQLIGTCPLTQKCATPRRPSTVKASTARQSQTITSN